MKNTVSRRDFLSQRITGTPSVSKNDQDDPIFKKYANSRMPFASLRTTTGLAPYTGSLTDADILHLLRRVTFGASKKSVDDTKAKGNLADIVNSLLNNPQYPASGPLNNYQPDYPDTQGVPYGESWAYYPSVDNGDNLLNLYRVDYSFKPWWMGLMITQPTHILEKMTLFWANHFGARSGDRNDPKAIWAHYDLIRKNALGSFRTMIKKITVNPHMLFILNGNLNSASAPDENYGRELQELFTVGKGPNSLYTEEDVKQAAKVLTGWRVETLPNGTLGAYFDYTQHDTSDKQFSSFYNNQVIKGQELSDGQNETDDLLNMLLKTDEAAKYIVRCIYRWFVYYVINDSEEQNVITPLAQIYRDNNYEILPVLTALFNSEHFFDPLNRGCVIKSPVDMYVGLNHEFSIQIPSDPIEVTYKHWKHFKDKCIEAGQNIGDPVDVSGWPAYRQQPVYYEAWINNNSIQKRAQNLNNYAIFGNALEPYNRTIIKIDSIAFNKTLSNPGDPNIVVSDFIKYLLPAPLSDKKVANMKSILLNNQDLANTPDYYWTNAWNAYIGTPGDAMKEATVRTILDKLVDYVTSLEEYQLC